MSTQEHKVLNQGDPFSYEISPETTLPIFLHDELSQEISNLPESDVEKMDYNILRSKQFRKDVESDWNKVRYDLILWIRKDLFAKKLTSCPIKKVLLSGNLLAKQRFLIIGNKIKSEAPNALNPNENEKNGIVDIKERQRRLREKQAENEEFIKEIDRLTSRCTALSSSIKFEKEKNESLKKEIVFRRKHFEDIEKNFNSFKDKNNPESKFFVMEMKNKLIRERLNELLKERIPELNTNKESVNDYGEKNEFRDLVVDNVCLTFIKYEGPIPTGLEKIDKQTFKIAKNSTFKTLKLIACQFWDLNNDSEYIITDEAEGMIYNEEVLIDSWLRDYSVLSNNFKLIAISDIKLRNRLVGNQESRVRENNKISSKGGKKQNLQLSGSGGGDSSKHKIREFFTEFQGLKPYTLTYQSENEIKKLDKAEDQAKNAETSFFLLIILILFFVLNLIFIYGTRDIGRNNLKINYIKSLFDNSSVNDYLSFYNWAIIQIFGNFSYLRTYNFNNVWQNNNSTPYVTNTLNALKSKGKTDALKFLSVKNLNTNTNRPEDQYFDPYILYDILEQKRNNSINFEFVSSIRLIMNKVKDTPCTTNKMVKEVILEKNEICYEVTHDSSTSYKEFSYNNIDSRLTSEEWIKNDYKNFTKYKTSKQAGVSLNIDTITGTYDGSGYHWDISNQYDFFDILVVFSKLIPTTPTFNKPTKSVLITSENNLETYFLVNKSVRNINFLFTLYFPDDNEWMSVLIGFDLPATGVISAGRMNLKMFKPNIYSGNNLFLTDILRLLICTIFIMMMITEFRQKYFRSIDYGVNVNLDSILEYILTPKTCLNLFIFIMYIVSFIYKLSYCNGNEKDFYDKSTKTYKDSFSVAVYYNQIFYFECLLFFGVVLKILTFLTLNDHIRFFAQTVQMGIIIYVKYLVIIIIIFVGYACIAHIIWGPYLDTFNSVSDSFLQILLMTMGFFNPNKMLDVSMGWTVIFITSFLAFVLFFMGAIFVSIYAESIRRIAVNYGYPDDNQKTQWNLRDYMVWICYCLMSENKKEKESG